MLQNEVPLRLYVCKCGWEGGAWLNGWVGGGWAIGSFWGIKNMQDLITTIN